MDELGQRDSFSRLVYKHGTNRIVRRGEKREGSRYMKSKKLNHINGQTPVALMAQPNGPF